MTRFEFYRTSELSHTAKNLATYIQMMCAISSDFNISNRQLCDFTNIKNLTTLNDCRKQLVDAGLIEYSHIMRGNKVISTTYKFKGFDDTKIIPNKNRINTENIPNNDDTIIRDTESIGIKNVSHTNIVNDYTFNSSTSVNECDARTHEGEVEILCEWEFIFTIFRDFYEKWLNNVYTPSGNESQCAEELMNKFRSFRQATGYHEKNNEENSFKYFLTDAYASADEWQKAHFNIKILNSQFNTFKNQIINGGNKNGKTNNGKETIQDLVNESNRRMAKYRTSEW